MGAAGSLSLQHPRTFQTLRLGLAGSGFERHLQVLDEPSAGLSTAPAGRTGSLTVPLRALEAGRAALCL
jgi:hypothetical protein